MVGPWDCPDEGLLALSQEIEVVLLFNGISWVGLLGLRLLTFVRKFVRGWVGGGDMIGLVLSSVAMKGGLGMARP